VSDADSYTPRHRPARRRSKSVTFVPLSPKSSKTLLRHRKQRSASPEPRRRSDAGPLIERRRHSSDDVTVRRRERSDSPSGSDDDVEYLPDRFDSQGRPLSPPTSDSRHWTERSGQFAYNPRHGRRSRTWDVNGGWHVGGTDPEVVERMAKQITDVIDGRMNWLGLITGVVQNLVEDGEGRGRRSRFRDLIRASSSN